MYPFINFCAFIFACCGLLIVYVKFFKKRNDIDSTEMWEILVPASSKSLEFTYEYHKLWDEFVKDISGGITIAKTVKGEWVSPNGVLYKDRMIPVRIKCTREQIIQIIRFTITHYKQEAVLAYRISDDVILIHKSDPNDVS